MADRLSFNRPMRTTFATATNATVTCTKAALAKDSGASLHIAGFIISASAAPAAAVEASITGEEGGATIKVAIPAAAFAPIIVMLPRPIKCAAATAAVLTVPALGAGVICDATLFTIAG